MGADLPTAPVHGRLTPKHPERRLIVKNCQVKFIPDYAARKFADEDARRRARRRTLVLQVFDNKADSVKLRAPCGFKCLRIYHELNSPFKMHTNYTIIHKNYFSQAFEVHNLGSYLTDLGGNETGTLHKNDL